MNAVEKLPYTVEKFDNERDWLTARLKGVGASECAAVVNRSRFCSEYGLYVRKLDGRVEEDDESEDAGEMSEWGHRLESAIARKFAEVMEMDCDE